MDAWAVPHGLLGVLEGVEGGSGAPAPGTMQSVAHWRQALLRLAEAAGAPCAQAKGGTSVKILRLAPLHLPAPAAWAELGVCLETERLHAAFAAVSMPRSCVDRPQARCPRVPYQLGACTWRVLLLGMDAVWGRWAASGHSRMGETCSEGVRSSCGGRVLRLSGQSPVGVVLTRHAVSMHLQPTIPSLSREACVGLTVAQDIALNWRWACFML